MASKVYFLMNGDVMALMMVISTSLIINLQSPRHSLTRGECCSGEAASLGD